MKCLIIAAGRGRRLRQKGDSKPLVPILGIALIERVIRAAMEAGADEFDVVIGYQGERVRKFLEHLAGRLAVRITPLVNDAWDKDNGLSVFKARDILHEPFLLLMADHLFDPNRETFCQPFEKKANPLALVADDDIKLIRTSFHGSADDTFNQGDAQDGDEGLAITPVLQPATLTGGDDQALHADRLTLRG